MFKSPVVRPFFNQRTRCAEVPWLNDSPLAEQFAAGVPVMLVIHILLLGFISFYIPLTKLSHYVGKFFTFHKVIWDNEPNLPGSKVEANILAAQQKPKDPNAKKWAAPHWNESAPAEEQK